MNREELLQTKCWSCWWREGRNCFSEEFGEIPRNEKYLAGHEITSELIARCSKSFVSKREVLGRVIPNDKLVILSEFAKKSEG